MKWNIDFNEVYCVISYFEFTNLCLVLLKFLFYLKFVVLKAKYINIHYVIKFVYIPLENDFNFQYLYLHFSSLCHIFMSSLNPLLKLMNKTSAAHYITNIPIYNSTVD